MKIPPRNVFSSFHSQPTSNSFVNDKKPKKARIESETTKLVFTSFFLVSRLLHSSKSHKNS